MSGHQSRPVTTSLAAARTAASLRTQGTGHEPAGHVITTQSVAFDGGDTATRGTSFHGGHDTAPQVKGMGHYRDRFQSTSEGWQRVHRTFTFG